MTTTFNTTQFKEAMSRFATGVTIVTALEEGAPVGFSCQTFVSLSLDPPLVALAPAKTSTSWPRIARAGSFCVNVLSARQSAVCMNFAVSGGDKFVGVPWHSAETGARRSSRARWPGSTASWSWCTTPATTSWSSGRCSISGWARGSRSCTTEAASAT